MSNPILLCGLAPLAVLAVLASAAAPARAAPLPVSAVVETPEAIFFQPVAFPEVVWYFPRSTARLFPVEPAVPGANYWRAAVELSDVDTSDLAALQPEWLGKSPVPYIVRPATECQLKRLPEMKFVYQEIRAQGHDISAASALPACQFVFRLPSAISPELGARLEALVASGTLVARDLRVSLELRAAVAWSTVHAAVAAALEDAGEGDPEGLTPEQALAAIQAALASEALAAVNTAMTPDEALAFIDRALAELFEPVDDSVALALVDTPPAGDVVHHVECVDRSL
jgi:hypothetical protein